MPTKIPPTDSIREMCLSITSRLCSHFSVKEDLLCCVFCAPVFIPLAERHFPHRVTVSRHDDRLRNIFYRLSIKDFHPARSDFRSWSALQSELSHPSISDVPRLHFVCNDLALFKDVASASAVIADLLPCRSARQRYGHKHVLRGYFTCDATSHGMRAYGVPRAMGEGPSKLPWERMSPARALERLQTEDLRTAADWEMKLSFPVGNGTIDGWLDTVEIGVEAPSQERGEM